MASTAKSLWLRSTVSLLILIGLISAAVAFRPRSTQVLLREGQEALVAGDLNQAAKYADQVLSREPQLTEALHLAGRARLESGDLQQALDFFDRIPDEKSLGAVQARCMSGEILAATMHDLSGAESQFRRALQIAPGDSFANDQLAWLLGLTARSWEATPYRLTTVQQERAERDQLFVLALGDLAQENPALLQEFQTHAPDDPAVLLALAVQTAAAQDAEQSIDMLRDVIRLRPEWIEPHVRLGRLLLESDALDDLPTWHASLPQQADTHPGIWAVRGLWARRQGDERAAVRCFWESVRRDPNVQQSNYQLGQALVALDRPDEAEAFLRRSEQLQNYLYRAHLVHEATPGADGPELLAAASAAAELGLIPEAYGWIRLVQGIPQSMSAARQLARDIPPPDPSLTTRCVPDADVALRVDYSDHPLPDWTKPPQTDPNAHNQPSTSAAEIRFEDQATAAGMRFDYVNGGNPDEVHILPLYEQTGGGIAALDFDVDGWPDLYMTQGSAWPPDPQQSENLDQLFRNTGRDTFLNVTSAAALKENSFSQGVAAGDFDNDGFTDLYVGNIGANTLWRNNGDGTFTDVTGQSQTAGNAWTTSCALCDVNGDTLPDLYAVNYLSGDDLFTRVCRHADGTERACRIQSFDAAQDQLFLNEGDGTFTDVTDESGITVPRGRGLGIVAANVDHSNRLSLFVANDVSPNFYFENQAVRGRPPQFAERGLLVGLSANHNGEYEAGMGVAVGDVDADGLLDLFVTNFERESNTLYRQEEGGLFADATAAARLAEPSRAWLGFGTQFLDADRDGDLDLMLTNGHIEDVRPQGLPFRMPPQMFQNRGDGTFDELTADQLGPYFEEGYLGRAVTRCDWNRDGAEDLVVSHLDAPAALLTNTSTPGGGSLTIHLRGTDSDRDAVGTTVTLEQDKQTFTRQRTAGDGYMASNQPTLLFGLPQTDAKSRITIRWPSGRTQTFDDVSAGSELIIVEGRDAPLVVENRK